MWPTMLSFHWSKRHQQLMTAADTCLKMVARATFCDSSLRLLQRVVYWKGPPLVASCISDLLGSDRKGYDLRHHDVYWKGPLLVWSLSSQFEDILLVSPSLSTLLNAGRLLTRYGSVIHANAADSLCRMIKMHEENLWAYWWLSHRDSNTARSIIHFHAVDFALLDYFALSSESTD
jgi:hypothetical protein